MKITIIALKNGDKSLLRNMFFLFISIFTLIIFKLGA
jgi:hypothetical protein